MVPLIELDSRKIQMPFSKLTPVENIKSKFEELKRVKVFLRKLRVKDDAYRS